MPVSRALPSGIAVQLLRAADLNPVPWKNGGGITREIIVEPPAACFDTFLWRISVADVAQAGPFSAFDGIDRIIVLTRGACMVLTDSATGALHTLRPGQPFHFAGETPIHADLPDGPTQDFNLMWRRGLASTHIDVRKTATRLELAAGSTVLHCIGGACRIDVLPGDSTGISTSGSPPRWPGLKDGAWQLQRGDTLHLNLRDAAVLSLAIEPMHDDASLLDIRITPVAT